MPTPETLTGSDIRALMSGNGFNKAHELVHSVFDAARAGDTLRAKVKDRQWYDVEVVLDASGIYGACTCQYSWQGHCKHIGAVLLKWLANTRDFVAAPAEEVTPPSPPGDLPGGVTPVTPPPATTPHQLPDWLARPHEARLAQDREQLREALATYRLDELRLLARARGWPLRGQRKDDIVEQVGTAMTRAEDYAAVIDRLEPGQRHMLWAIGLLDELQAPYLRGLPETVASWNPADASPDLYLTLGALADAGLIVFSEAQFAQRSALTLMPRALARAMPPFLGDALPRPGSDRPAAGFDTARLADPTTFVRGVNQLVTLLDKAPPDLRAPQPRPNLERTAPGLRGWDYDSAEVARLTRAGKFQTTQTLRLTIPPPAYPFPDDAMSRLAPLVGDEAQLDFVYPLLVEAGLLMPGSPATVWPEVREAYSRLDEAAQVAVLARVYFSMLGWSEIWPVARADPTLRLMRVTVPAYANYGLTPQTLQANLTAYRRMTLGALARLPDGEWLALDDVFALLRRAWPQFDQSLFLPTGFGVSHINWLLTRQGEALNPASAEDWAAGPGAFVRQMLTSPLSWLGLVDLGLTGDRVTHIRLTGLADLFWDRVEARPVRSPVGVATATPAIEDIGARLTVDGLLLHVDPTAVSSQGHQLFDHIARLEAAQPGRFTYRLDATAAHQSFESGLTLPQLTAQWEQTLGAPMPSGVRDVVEQWWGSYGQARLYQGVTIIELGDDYALSEIKAATSLGQVMIAELSPRLVVIPHSAVDRLIAELERAGYTPKRETSS